MSRQRKAFKKYALLMLLAGQMDFKAAPPPKKTAPNKKRNFKKLKQGQKLYRRDDNGEIIEVATNIFYPDCPNVVVARSLPAAKKKFNLLYQK